MGIISSPTNLTNTDALLGLSGIAYPVNGPWGLDNFNDTVTLTSYNSIYSDLLAQAWSDNYRVLTAEIPEPPTYLIMGGALGLLALFIHRKNPALCNSPEEERKTMPN